MKLVEFKIQVSEDGSVFIPTEAVKEMKMDAGEILTLLYFSTNELENEARTFLVSDIKLQELSDAKLSIPKELLFDAEIALEAALDVVCTKGRITIMASKKEDMIPKELLDMLEEMGISKEKANIALRVEEGDKLETKTVSNIEWMPAEADKGCKDEKKDL